MQTQKIIYAVMLALLLFSSTGLTAEAASGLPNSPEFGYGARVSTTGQQITQALALAPDIGLDWIAVNFDWARLWPNPDVEPDFSTLFGLIGHARQKNLSVLVSISNPPAWAMTPSGPNPDTTAAITLRMVSSYHGSLLVVELFPGANTGHGWGTTPNPKAYIGMIQIARNALANQNLQAYVIPSFSPLSTTPSAGDIDDLTFLKKFYEAGMPTPIVGLRYQEIVGQPISDPAQGEFGVLRHYEFVRNFMLQNNHRTDLIWITGFSWPSQLASMEEQASWVYDAYKLLKAQLYIGAVFFNSLNPSSPEELFYNPASLVLADGSLHPAAIQLRRVSSTTGESFDTALAVPQIQKGIIKKHIHKTILKRPSS